MSFLSFVLYIGNVKSLVDLNNEARDIILNMKVNVHF